MPTLPPPLSWLWEGWMLLSKAIEFVMSRVILTVLWIVGIGVYAIVLFPFRFFTKKKKGNWIDVKPEPVEHMKYPF